MYMYSFRKFIELFLAYRMAKSFLDSISACIVICLSPKSINFSCKYLENKFKQKHVMLRKLGYTYLAIFNYNMVTKF